MKKQFYVFLTIALSLILFACEADTRNFNRDKENVSEEETLQKESEKILDQVNLPKGLIKIPGYAYLDGRDLQAKPPLTIGKINIWDSYNRNRVVCKLAHGTKVKILNAKYDAQEQRYYLNIQYDDCEGWVSDPFISTEKMKPIGDVF